ncbi:hypothetical protein, partial [Acetobacter estunensis]|uniref:hypothetical protein n=1 Tax=Acetobacter estunensis TaxID=104097 RepID=UPI00222E940D
VHIQGLNHTLTEFPNRLLEHPDLSSNDRRNLRKLRNLYWNAFKHASKREGKNMRDDAEILSQFNDTVNDHTLFIGWGDYRPIARALPIEAQVFAVWYMVLYEEKVAPGVDLVSMRRRFPDLRSLDRLSQKRMLRNVIAQARQQNDLMSNHATDQDPLILGPSVSDRK